MSNGGSSFIRVSDHALLRFLQRAGGLDVDGCRANLEGSLKRAAFAAESIGAIEYAIIADGMRYVVRDGIVVTVVFDGPVDDRGRPR